MTEKSAFPQMGSGYQSPQSGMSLRDYFAAAGLTGVAASPHTTAATLEDIPLLHKRLAQIAYDMADAMLKEREK